MADEVSETTETQESSTQTATAERPAKDASVRPDRSHLYDYDDLDDGFSDGEENHVEARENKQAKTETDADSGSEDDEDDDSAGDSEGATDTKTDAAKPGAASIDAALLSRAQKLGISAEEARKIAPDALKTALDLVERRAGTSSDSGQSQKRETTDAAQGKTEQKKPRIEWEDVQLPEEFDPTLHKVVNNLKTVVSQVNAALDEMDSRQESISGQTRMLAEKEQSRESEAFYDRFDNWVQEMGADWEPVFGKGNRKTIGDNKAAIEARSAVLNEMLIYAAGYRQANQDLPEEHELFKRAVRALHGDKTEKMAAQKVTKNLRDRKSGQFVSRPTQRESRGDKGNPEQRAQSFVNRFFHERGISDEHDDGI